MLMLTIAIIGLVIGIYRAFLETLKHFNLTLPTFGKLMAKMLVNQPWDKIFGRIFIGAAALISLILFIAVVSIISTQPFTDQIILSTLIFVVMGLLGIWGIWMPLSSSKGGKQLQTTMNIIGAFLFIMLFACYWLYEWPEWHTPAILLSFLVVVVVFGIVYSLLEKRKNKAKAQSAVSIEKEVSKH